MSQDETVTAGVRSVLSMLWRAAEVIAPAGGLAAVGVRARVRWHERCEHEQLRCIFTSKLVATLVATPFV
jgi:hypothetical protein